MTLTIIELVLIWFIPFISKGEMNISDILSFIAIDIIAFLPLLLMNNLIKFSLQAWGIIPFPKEEEIPQEQPKQTLTLDDHAEEIQLAEQHLKEILEWRARKD